MIRNFAKIIISISTKSSISHLQSKKLHNAIQKELRKDGYYGNKVSANVKRGVKKQ